MNETSKMVINMENNALTHEHLPRSQNMGLGGGLAIWYHIFEKCNPIVFRCH